MGQQIGHVAAWAVFTVIWAEAWFGFHYRKCYAFITVREGK